MLNTCKIHKVEKIVQTLHTSKSEQYYLNSKGKAKAKTSQTKVSIFPEGSLLAENSLEPLKVGWTQD